MVMKLFKARPKRAIRSRQARVSSSDEIFFVASAPEGSERVAVSTATRSPSARGTSLLPGPARRIDKARAGPFRTPRRAAGAALEAHEDLRHATSARCHPVRPPPPPPLGGGR